MLYCSYLFCLESYKRKVKENEERLTPPLSPHERPVHVLLSLFYQRTSDVGMQMDQTLQINEYETDPYFLTFPADF